MHNITLVGTLHSELGKCNADELFKIIEQISPDVVFEELTPYLYDILYNKGIFDESAPIEFKCIRRYKQQHNINNIPVDIEVGSTLSNNVNQMLALFEKYDIYKVLKIAQKKKIELEGFDFLNSDEFSDLVEKQRAIEKKIVEEINNSQLNRIYKSFLKDLDFRENYMLNTIYNYSLVNDYDHAVFLIGAGHRRSVIRKVAEYQLKETIKMNWSFYGTI
jgi:pheromone shutdown protein TraB